MEEVRNISYSLHPRVAEDLGLVPALEFLAHRIGERGTLAVSLTADVGARRISATDSATLFRVAQESLKDAEARAPKGKAEILLYISDESICLVISDDCDGMDSRTAKDDNVGNGLSSIMDRVTLGGGAMRIEQRRNGGTRVITELQCSENVE
jgi:signal transduction histidine kinase